MVYSLDMNTLPPIIIATICYLWIAYGTFRQGDDHPHALMWFAYAIANGSFIWYELRK